jgi:hypothetical protein
MTYLSMTTAGVWLAIFGDLRRRTTLNNGLAQATSLGQLETAHNSTAGGVKATRSEVLTFREYYVPAAVVDLTDDQPHHLNLLWRAPRQFYGWLLLSKLQFSRQSAI